MAGEWIKQQGAGSAGIGSLGVDVTLATITVVGEILLRIKLGVLTLADEMEIRVEVQRTAGGGYETLQVIHIASLQDTVNDDFGPYWNPHGIRFVLRQLAGTPIADVPWAVYSKGDVVAEDVRLARAGVAAKRTFDQATGEKKVYDTDGSTVLTTLTVTASEDGTLVTEAPA